RPTLLFSIADSSSNPHYELSRPGGIAGSPNGALFIYDMASKVIRQYDGSGRFVRDIGRDGDGPGEYRMVDGMAVDAEGRLFVLNARASRIDVFDSAGRGLKRIIGLSSGIGNVFGMLRVGSKAKLVLKTSIFPKGGGESQFASTVYDSTGKVVDTLFLPKG